MISAASKRQRENAAGAIAQERAASFQDFARAHGHDVYVSPDGVKALQLIEPPSSSWHTDAATGHVSRERIGYDLAGLRHCLFRDNAGVQALHLGHWSCLARTPASPGCSNASCETTHARVTSSGAPLRELVWDIDKRQLTVIDAEGIAENWQSGPAGWAVADAIRTSTIRPPAPEYTPCFEVALSGDRTLYVVRDESMRDVSSELHHAFIGKKGGVAHEVRVAVELSRKNFDASYAVTFEDKGTTKTVVIDLLLRNNARVFSAQMNGKSLPCKVTRGYYGTGDQLSVPRIAAARSSKSP